jgi:hypothetical protein
MAQLRAAPSQLVLMIEQELSAVRNSGALGYIAIVWFVVELVGVFEGARMVVMVVIPPVPLRGETTLVIVVPPSDILERVSKVRDVEMSTVTIDCITVPVAEDGDVTECAAESVPPAGGNSVPLVSAIILSSELMTDIKDGLLSGLGSPVVEKEVRIEV